MLGTTEVGAEDLIYFVITPGMTAEVPEAASDVSVVNLDAQLNVCRGFQARSGVMHSMSSMERQASHSLASFQLRTPRRFFTCGGVRRLFGADFFSGVSLAILHRVFVTVSHCSAA